MTRRIVLTGAESTGKSSLVEALSAELGIPASPEFVREFVAARNRAVEAWDVEDILEGQRAAERAVLASGAPAVLHDTNVLSTVLYARELYRIDLAISAEEIEGPDIFYLLCLPDIPWLPDPHQRESPESRDQFHALFVRELKERALPFAEVGGRGAERLARAKTAVREFLESR